MSVSVISIIITASLRRVPYNKYFRINFIYKGNAYTVKSTNKTLFKAIVSHMRFPLDFKIKPYVRSKKNRNKHTT